MPTKYEKIIDMIDTKSKLILKILAKECANGSYKIVETADISLCLPRHLRMDSENIKHSLNHLEHEGLISIKYEDDNTFCLAVLPYGFQTLEADEQRFIQKGRSEQKLSRLAITLSFLASFLGTVLGILVSYFIIKLF